MVIWLFPLISNRMLFVLPSIIGVSFGYASNAILPFVEPELRITIVSFE